MILRVTARMAAPVAFASPPHLDAILTGGHPHAKSVHPTRSMSLRNLPRIRLPIYFADVLGVSIAVASAAEVDADARSEREHLRRSKDSVDLHVRAGRWEVGAGAERACVIPIPTTATREVTWYAVGDRRGVLELLRHVRAIGSHRRHGYGRVASWSVDRVEASPDRCLVVRGCAARNLPASWCVDAIGVDDGLAAPYWHPERRGPCVRAGTRAELRPEVVGAISSCSC